MSGYSGQTATELYAAGYRQTSRALGIVSRVDITDDEMVALFIHQNFGDRWSGVPSCSLEEQRDHYRRCVSRDRIEGVPARVMDELRRKP